MEGINLCSQALSEAKTFAAPAPAPVAVPATAPVAASAPSLEAVLV